MSFEFLTVANLVQFALFFAVIFLCAKPLGIYIAQIYSGEKNFAVKTLGWLEKGIYKISGINPEADMRSRDYAIAVGVFSLVNFIALFLILRFQSVLGLNPEGLPNVETVLAFSTAASFITNTNWQSYAGESTMSYFSQMAGLTVQNFISAATGMAVMAAMIRGFARKNATGIGNFWSDFIRGNIYILLPLAIVVAIILASQGVVQTLDGHKVAEMVQPDGAAVSQKIAVGPVASQVAIKQIGSNGGGFFNANSAHPFENPTPFSNFIEMVMILLVPVALCYTFGRMVGDLRQGRALLIAMTIIFVPLLLVITATEQAGNHVLTGIGADQHISDMQSGGNMEGKETRFGVMNSAIFSSATTAASAGAVNAMHDSYSPLGGMMLMVMMQFGEVIFGGVGSGIYGMLVFVILAVFVSGLMVGRTPEYLGKKIQASEIKMASIAVLIPPFLVLVGTAIAVLTEAGRAGLHNPGAHGFAELHYAFTSTAHNNGSAFAGLGSNTPFYNIIFAIVMLCGRFFIMLSVLAMAGSLASKNTTPQSVGTLPTHTPLFIFILIAVLLTGILTYIPSLALGPVAEHYYSK